MTNEHMVRILSNPFISVMPVARILNPEHPTRVHAQLRTANPTFTEDQLQAVSESPEWNELVELIRPDEVFAYETFINDVCMAFRHDFMSLTLEEKAVERSRCKDMIRAIMSNIGRPASRAASEIPWRAV